MTADRDAEVDEGVESGVDLAAVVRRGGEVELGLGGEEGEPVTGAGEQRGGEQDEQRAGRERQDERDEAHRQQDEAARLHTPVRVGRRAEIWARTRREHSALIAPSSARFDVSSRWAA